MKHPLPFSLRFSNRRHRTDTFGRLILRTELLLGNNIFQNTLEHPQRLGSRDPVARW
jgi:hypothetical protein